MKVSNAPLVLVILDGWGLREEKEGNAIAQAGTPNMDMLYNNYPHNVLSCSGEDVGLPEGQMGNSEVGHLNLGAGRVVYQELTRITKSIKTGDFYNNDVLLDAVDHAKKNNSSLHLMGLLSDGGVHSHINHLFALLELARDQGIENVYLHTFLDGRDVPPDNALEYIDALEKKVNDIQTGTIAVVSGRYYAMDRDRRWDRTERAYRAMVLGEGLQVSSAREAVEKGYERGETDEFIQPSVVTGEDGQPVGKVKDGDAIIFFNFRPDRARQITRSFVDKEFNGFERPVHPSVHFTCMTQYDKTINAPVAFKPAVLVNTLGEVLSYNKLKQLRLAETEKYAHVTFFFNGGVEKPNPGEERRLIPSPKVSTYDLKPEMSAYEVTDAFIEELNKNEYDVIIMNYANPDMVGHTGDMGAAVKAVEAVDDCIGRVVKAVREKNGTLIVTADHGNAEIMTEENGDSHTAHTVSPVPFILVRPGEDKAGVSSGRLEDVAPVMLYLLGVTQPEEMTGKVLIQE